MAWSSCVSLTLSIPWTFEISVGRLGTGSLRLPGNGEMYAECESATFKFCSFIRDCNTVALVSDYVCEHTPTQSVPAVKWTFGQVASFCPLVNVVSHAIT